MENVLSPKWGVWSDSFEAFFDQLDKLEKRTEIINVHMDKIGLVSVLTETKKELELGPMGDEINSKTEWAVKIHQSDGIKKKIMKYPKSKAISFEDEIEDVRTLMILDGQILPMSYWAVRDLADRARCLCPAIENPSMERDAFIVSNFRAGKVSIILRRDGVDKKVFAVRGHSYKAIPQTETIKKVIGMLEDELGRSKCERFQIDNEITQLTISFPEKKEELEKLYPGMHEMIPIVRITTSDIGKSAFRVSAGFQIEKTQIYRPQAMVDIAHDHGFKWEKFKKDLDKKVFPELISIPRELSRLSEIEVNSVLAVDEVISFINMEKKPGLKGVSKSVIETLKAEYFGVVNAADLVISLITVPERLVLYKVNGDERKLAKSTIASLTECLGDAFFCPFEISDTGSTMVILPA